MIGPHYRQTLSYLEISSVFALLLFLIAIRFPRFCEGTFRFVENAFSRFAEKKTLAIRVIFLSVVAIRLATLSLLPVPVPGIHDEYSYLLMADTFAHGRLANPPHPMWVSFETFHVNWLPTYSSIYPPAQGLVLAIGQVLRQPWIGVMLSCAAMCAAILWMLQAWMPARWAFLGAALAALKFCIASYWMNSYWGGAVAATGGALVLGALPRIVKRATAGDAILLGLGVAILANSRPYEGFLFCLPAAGWFLWWLVGKTKAKNNLRLRLRNGFLPVTAVLILTVAFMGYYNWRLTGNALLLPHVLNTRMYHTTPLFLWEKTKPPLHYNNAQFETFYNGWERGSYQGGWVDVLRVSAEKVIRFGLAYFWIGALFVAPALPRLFRGRKIRFLLVTLVVCGGGVFAVVWFNPHYVAPLTCVIYALIVQGMRWLRAGCKVSLPMGLVLSRAIVVLLVLDTGMLVFRHMCDPVAWQCQGDPSRAAIAAELHQRPGKHLVMVRYEKNHNIHDEWVYNGAEIDSAKILWARELSPEQNARLFTYFKDRRIWLADPELNKFSPYPEAGGKVEKGVLKGSLVK